MNERSFSIMGALSGGSVWKSATEGWRGDDAH